MIVEWGHFCLILAFCLSVLQGTLPFVGTYIENNEWMRLAKSTAVAQFIFVSLSFFSLAYAFLSNDFSVAYVAQNSNSHLPWIYRFCAIWGAHEGSLLLWVFILSIWTLAVALFSKNLPLVFRTRILVVLAWIALGFYLLLLMTSNPFLRLLPNFPIDGRDLNPLLQDPGLVSHPPMLYMGYVGFAVAFAFAVSALIGGKLDAKWASWTRPWTLCAWSFLTLGIVLGSLWSYRELGWGGWWFWDPVENASFMPWLCGTALIHSLMVSEKRNTLKAWTVLLAIGTFSLSLLGTFLVRSGVLISVHAFAVDPIRGAFILRFLTVVIGGSLLLYAWRGRSVSHRVQLEFFSRETMLLLNNVILFVAMLTVLLGTLYPLIIDDLDLGKLSVGAPYFNSVFIPLMIPLLFLMGVGPLFYWQHSDPYRLIRRCSIILMLSIVFSLGTLMIAHFSLKISVILGLILAFWLLLHTIIYGAKNFTRARLGMISAHAGVAVTVIGIVISSHYTQEKNLRLQLGEGAQIDAYHLTLQKLQTFRGGNYEGTKATVLVEKNQQSFELYPEQRIYTVSEMALAKIALDRTLFRDLYVALGEPLPDEAWGFRLYYKPMIFWIWMGGVLMALGGLLAAFVRRR